ncbi:MAG: HAMP domain-containing histidine kinase [Clostridia bacterium]|nr:HAMP domain-containing histidine kinase [Clostridia bacterium]
MAALLCIIGVLSGIIVALTVKIHFMHKSVQEICAFLQRYMEWETNTLIDIPSKDRYMRMLADAINRELRMLRRQRNQFLNGNRELKVAVADISHDLRTPLTAISGYLELLNKEDKPENIRRYLSVIAERTEAMKTLTEELFRYSVAASTGDSLMLEAVNVNGVLEEAVAAQYAELCKRGIQPDIRMTDRIVMLRLNREALTRIFGNLITNAVRYSDGDLLIELSCNGTISFANTASKLDEVQVGKLFDRFYTVEAANHSTGLGLSIAKALAEQMGGRIRASYTEGKLMITVTFERLNLRENT